MDELRKNQCQHALAGLLVGFTGRSYETCWVIAERILVIVLGAIQGNAQSPPGGG